MPLVCGADPQATKSKAPAKQDKKQDDAEKAADRILAESKDLDVVTEWYDKVYPALKKKYGKPVSRERYDGWRELYFKNEVSPRILKAGYGLEPARQSFMKATEKQLSN